MENLETSNKPDTSSTVVIEKTKENSGHFVWKLIKCCVGFAMFEWVAGQTFKQVIGMNTLDSWLIGLAFFLLYLILAIKFKETLVESMFE